LCWGGGGGGGGGAAAQSVGKYRSKRESGELQGRQAVKFRQVGAAGHVGW
jgi:hypothetical protein